MSHDSQAIIQAACITAAATALGSARVDASNDPKLIAQLARSIWEEWIEVQPKKR